MASPYDQIIASTAAKYRIPAPVLDHLVRQESGYNPEAKSPAGAEGLTQLMPATAQSLGVTDPFNPAQSIEGGAKYLSEQLARFGSLPLALAAYNAGPNAVARYGGVPPYAETQNYVKAILAGLSLPAASAGGDLAPTPTATPANAPVTTPPAPVVNQTPVISPQLLGVINANNRLLGLPALNIPLPPPSPAPPPVATPKPRRPQAATAPANTHAQQQGFVTLAPNADRPGVHIHPQVVQFVGDIAALYGKPLEIGTGTNHNEYVKGSNRESAHWTGWAADVPATGDALTRLGQTALIAAGMDPRRAKAAKGGLFNVNGYQIIFNSNIGGNHWNHVHIGFAPSRQKA